jgi:phosphoribosylaminoimidazole-succinocarboxamide synthase
MLPIECVVRGYITGSGWKDYKSTGQVCGVQLPPNLQESQQLPEPIFTPTTKAHAGHDEPLDREGAVALVGEERFEILKNTSIELYRFGSDYAASRGIILADTKLEFGLDETGQIVLGDELFTPDSSRFWPANGFKAGRPQPSFDKQYVRDYAESLDWDKTPPGPELPEKVVTGTRRRYLEAYERLTGISFSDYAARPQVVLG